MKSSINPSLPDNELGIYECEVRLKFRILEEKLAMDNREDLLETLMDAYAYGSDEYLEALSSHVKIEEIEAIEASPAMRRQLIRLRNSQKLV
jgi:hypothetical protein